MKTIMDPSQNKNSSLVIEEIFTKEPFASLYGWNIVDTA